MTEYPHIRGVWKRQSEKPHELLIGEWACPEFEALKDNVWHWTEKVDGTNVRVLWDGNRVLFGGKTDRAQMPAVLVKALTEQFGGPANEQMFEQVFNRSKTEVCLYGEGYGAGIQKGGRYRDTVGFILFDVKIGNKWLSPEDVQGISIALDCDTVPEVFKGQTLSQTEAFVRTVVLSDGELPSAVSASESPAEGVVGRAPCGMRNQYGERILVKIKAADFRG